MARSGVPTDIGNDVVKPFILVKAMFDAPLYLWTGQRDKDFNGDTYLGEGALLSFDGVEENSDLGANGITLGMAFSSNNLTADIMQKVVSDDYQGNPITISLTFDRGQGGYSTPIVLFHGFIDVMSVEDDGNVANIKLTAENSLIRLGRKNNRRYTNRDQQFYFSGDDGLIHSSGVQEKQVIWGRAAEGE
jgi:hypothetical protein